MMLLRSFSIALMAFFLFMLPVSGVLAADRDEADTPKEASEPLPEDPVFQEKSDRLNTEVMELVKSLDNTQGQHFMVMYTNYTVISMVKAVEKDVKNAVEACAKNNRDMKDELDSRFSKWQQTVAAPMSDAMANINNMIVAQQYASRDRIEEIFAQVEDVRSYNSSRFEKVPVSTKEACAFMMGKMEETQENMAALLKTTLYSYPGALQRSQK